MDKLVDLLGTKYAYSYYAGEVSRIAQQYLQEKKPLDLAGARISEDSLKQLIVAEQNGLELHDTADPNREADLALDRERVQFRMSHEYRDIGFPRVEKDLEHYLCVPEPGYVYKVTRRPSMADLAFLYFLIAMRPEIMVDLDASTETLFTMISEHLDFGAHKWDSYMVLQGKTFRVFQEYQPGCVNVPAEFGNRELINDPNWDSCTSYMIHLFQSQYRPKQCSIADYLGG